MDKKPLTGEYTWGQAAESFWDVACELLERLETNLGEEGYALLKRRLGIVLVALGGLVGLGRVLGALGAGRSFVASASGLLGWLGLLLLGAAFLTGIAYLYLERARAAGLDDWLVEQGLPGMPGEEDGRGTGLMDVLAAAANRALAPLLGGLEGYLEGGSRPAPKLVYRYSGPARSAGQILKSFLTAVGGVLLALLALALLVNLVLPLLIQAALS